MRVRIRVALGAQDTFDVSISRLVQRPCTLYLVHRPCTLHPVSISRLVHPPTRWSSLSRCHGGRGTGYRGAGKRGAGKRGAGGRGTGYRGAGGWIAGGRGAGGIAAALRSATAQWIVCGGWDGAADSVWDASWRQLGWPAAAEQPHPTPRLTLGQLVDLRGQ